jgi:ketosteroid isomerase-like protein
MSAKKADIESAKAAIQALNEQWEINFENHDLAGLAALFTEDCVRMPQGGPATRLRRVAPRWKRRIGRISLRFGRPGRK